MIENRKTSLAGLAVVGTLAVLIGLQMTGTPARPPAVELSLHNAEGDPTEGLPPTSAGLPSLLGPASQATTLPLSPAPPSLLQPDDSGAGGSIVRGRVARIYVQAESHVFIDIDSAPQHLKVPGRLFADVEMPGTLRNGLADVRGFLGEGFAQVRPGDIVTVRIAHRHDRTMAQVFPVREVTRVTSLVAPRGSELARAYERAVLARKFGDTTVARWNP